MGMKAARTAWALLALGVVAGCSGSPPPLRPEAFLPDSHAGVPGGTITGQTDVNGTLVYGDLHAPLLPDEYGSNPNGKAPVQISRVVSETVAASQPVLVPTTAPTTTASSQPAPGIASTYQIVGTVLATVNGQPIYADEVLKAIEPQLRARARELGYEQFRDVAAQAIAGQRESLIDDRLRVAAAEEYLSADSKANADRLAQLWKDGQITAAGGSIELAKQRCIQETGKTLDEEARVKRGLFLSMIYVQQRIWPLVDVAPADMRQYYERNLANQFTQTAAVKFHLIKIDIARRGGPNEALLIAKEVIQKLRAGADFEQLARTYGTDDPVLARSGGAVMGGAWVEKGAYVNDYVESEVWKMRPTEFSDPPIEDRRSDDPAFYIALLDAKKSGAVKPFDDDEVQAQIWDTLRREQLSLLQSKLEARLNEQSITVRNPVSFQAAIDMAMERYAQWRGAGTGK
jgi:hypothetical protein